MAVNIRGKSLLTLLDYSREQIEYIIELAAFLKAERRAGIRQRRLTGKSIVLIFEKTSTRTRCAFELAAAEEGAQVTFLTNSQLGKKESLEDTAKVLGRFYDGIGFRGYEQKTVEELATYSGIPVWNGLTDMYHPTQVLADVLTIKEKTCKNLSDVKLVYSGDARNNVANSLMIISAILGMHYTALCPPELAPEPELVKKAEELAKKSGGSIITGSDLSLVEGADAIYTDVWVSMGEEDKISERIKLLEPYRVDMDLINKTGNPNVLFLHCLPAFHDTNTEMGKLVEKEYGIKEMEVSDEVFRSRHSVVFEEAENRLHTIKAVILASLGAV
ncbi:ornithine carbamoyltransferase [Spirochaetia bacterium 38H-sp]|uniref:Ornithine carbamoyltransferase n=1 Tax=Rarispira pelagica TaxID=3141764 RepID=A0ABU9UDZ1_9SPIR